MTQRLSGYKLPPGRHGLAPEHVAASQRWRLLGAATEMLEEGGYRGLTTHTIAARAAVSSRALYVHFGGRDECLRAAFAAAATVLGEAEGLAGAVELLGADPPLASLFGLEARAAVPGLAAAFAAFAESFAPEPRARLLLAAALTLLAERRAGHPVTPAERAAEVADLIGYLDR